MGLCHYPWSYLSDVLKFAPTAIILVSLMTLFRVSEDRVGGHQTNRVDKVREPRSIIWEEEEFLTSSSDEVTAKKLIVQ